MACQRTLEAWPGPTLWLSEKVQTRCKLVKQNLITEELPPKLFSA